VAVAVVVVRSGPQQEYASLPPPCTLVTAATLAEYLPGAVSAPPGAPSGSCRWVRMSGGEFGDLLIVASLFRSSSGVTLAQKGFATESGFLLRSSLGGITLGVSRQPVTGLGDQAAAQLFWTRQASPPHQSGVALFVRSGNVDVTVLYSITAAGPSGSAAGRTILQAAITVGRDVLSGLANPRPAAAAPPPGQAAAPHYLRPSDPCVLIKRATLAKYLPDARPGLPSRSASGTWHQDSCSWHATGGASLNLDVTTFSAADGAAQADNLYEAGIPAGSQGWSDAGIQITIDGTQAVTGLGELASAIFQTLDNPAGSIAQTVVLSIWAANAEIRIQIHYYVMPPHPDQLAAAIAVARDVLAALLRS
jgi:hypothetical protein